MLAQANIQHLPLADNSIDLIFTDPPYPREYLPCYGWLAHEAARVLKPGGFVMCMAGGYFLNKIYAMFEAVPALNYFWEFHHRSNGEAPYIWPRFVVAKTKVILAYSKGEGLTLCLDSLLMLQFAFAWIGTDKAIAANRAAVKAHLRIVSGVLAAMPTSVLHGWMVIE